MLFGTGRATIPHHVRAKAPFRTMFGLVLWLGSLAVTAALPDSRGLSTSSSSSVRSTPTATVLNGTYAGIYSPEYDEDYFLGIPFAQPPVGELRFRQALPLNTTWTDTKNAISYSPECYGYGSDDWVLGNRLSEDCLTLNIVRPHGVTPADRLPVGFWIHGGGNYEGGNSDPRYNLSFIVQQSVAAGKPFIGVGVNYRLQGLGFLFGNEVLEAGAANIGLHDQRRALRWVQENIGAFGGDPAKVAVWGESAGASDIGAHLLAHGGRDEGLFRAAIMESGAPAGKRFATADAWQPGYDAIVGAANCTAAADTLACLRRLPIDALSAVLNGSATANSSFGPVCDGDLIRATSGTRALAGGAFVRVPILHGRNHDEGTMFATKGIDTDAEFEAMLSASGLDDETVAIFAALYPDIPEIGIPATLRGRPPPSASDLGRQWKRASAYAGDNNQHTGRRIMSQTWARNNLSSYSYVFNVLPEGIDATVGATHFTEVSFVFHNILGVGYDNAVASPPFAGAPQTYVQTSTIMSRMWASFISDLDPNNNGGELDPVEPLIVFAPS